jgi:hypothetical protein
MSNNDDERAISGRMLDEFLYNADAFHKSYTLSYYMYIGCCGSSICASLDTEVTRFFDGITEVTFGIGSRQKGRIVAGLWLRGQTVYATGVHLLLGRCPQISCPAIEDLWYQLDGSHMINIDKFTSTDDLREKLKGRAFPMQQIGSYHPEHVDQPLPQVVVTRFDRDPFPEQRKANRRKGRTFSR